MTNDNHRKEFKLFGSLGFSQDQEWELEELKNLLIHAQKFKKEIKIMIENKFGK